MTSSEQGPRSRDRNRAIQGPKPCGPGTETVRSRDRNRAVQGPKPCGPGTETVRSRDRNRAVQGPKPCGPGTETVRSRTPKCLACLIGGARKSGSTVSRPALAGRRSPSRSVAPWGFTSTSAPTPPFGAFHLGEHEGKHELTGQGGEGLARLEGHPDPSSCSVLADPLPSRCGIENSRRVWANAITKSLMVVFLINAWTERRL